MSKHTTAHLNAALKLVRYLKLTTGQGLLFSSTNILSLSAYCDADWAACPSTRRSLSAYCILLRSSLISWKSKKQTTVARSSAEAEYRSMTNAACEVTWLVSLLKNFDVSVPTPLLLFCDNQAAIHISSNPVFHERTKHIVIDCHLGRDKINSGLLSPHYIASGQQLTDLLTKALSSHQIGSL